MGMRCCCCSVTKSGPTLCDPMECSTPGCPVFHYLLEFAQTHILWVGDATKPSHLLLPSSPFAFNPSQHKGLCSELALCIRWPKYWSFSFSISPSNEYSVLISFSVVWSPCSLRDSQESSSTPQFENISFLTLSLLDGPALTSVPDNWRNHNLIIWTFIDNVMSLLFNMPSKFVIAFLPRSKHLLISRLQSPCTVILEPKKMKLTTPIKPDNPIPWHLSSLLSWPTLCLWSVFLSK